MKNLCVALEGPKLAIFKLVDLDPLYFDVSIALLQPQHCSRSRLEVQELRQKFSSQRMRLKVKILVLVSMHETESKNSRFRLEARD